MISYEELSLVFDMDNPLTLEYFEICDKHTDEPKYFEKHHILPKSMFKEYRLSKFNIVRLTYQDHYIIHEILPFICLQKRHQQQMIYAWNRLLNSKSGLVTSKEIYAELRMLHSLAASQRHTGKKLSKETIAKFLKSRGVFRHTDESKKLMASQRTGELNVMFGKTHTPEARDIQSKASIKPVNAFLKYISENTEYVILSEYKKRTDAMDFKCLKHDHTFRETPSKIMYKGRGCKYCRDEKSKCSGNSKINPNASLLEREAHFLKYLKEFTNLTMLSPFISSHTESIFQCSEGHKEFPAKPVNVKRNTSPKCCPECARLKKVQGVYE
jgi:hypothetical protein